MKDEYELARRLIHILYRVRDGFRHVRRPLITVAEYPDDMKNLPPHEAFNIENRHRADSYVYQKRWEVLLDSLRDLETEMVQAQVFWGQEIQELMLPVRQCAFRLQDAIQNLLSSLKGEDLGLTKEERVEDREILYGGGKKGEDSFADKIQSALDAIETKARPHLKPERK